MEIKTIGVIGSGIMGSGLAQVCAQSGYDVIVSAKSEEKIKKGLTSIDKMLTKGIEKGKLSQQDKESAISRIKAIVSVQDFSGFSDCDLIMEAVTENMNIKKDVFSKADKACPEHSVFATCTSGLSVIDMGWSDQEAGQSGGNAFLQPGTNYAVSGNQEDYCN